MVLKALRTGVWRQKLGKFIKLFTSFHFLLAKFLANGLRGNERQDSRPAENILDELGNEKRWQRRNKAHIFSVYALNLEFRQTIFRIYVHVHGIEGVVFSLHRKQNVFDCKSMMINFPFLFFS